MQMLKRCRVKLLKKSKNGNVRRWKLTEEGTKKAVILPEEGRQIIHRKRDEKEKEQKKGWSFCRSGEKADRQKQKCKGWLGR